MGHGYSCERDDNIFQEDPSSTLPNPQTDEGTS